jgi:peptide/nickel transport system permease protein
MSTETQSLIQPGMWQRFRSDRRGRFAFRLLGFIVLVALLADVLATSQPLFVTYKGNSWFPAFSSIVNPNRTEIVTDPVTGAKETLQFDILDWKELPTETVIWALVPWSPGKPDPLNRDYTGPFDAQMMKSTDGKIIPVSVRHRHVLGTDQLGNDLLSGLIHGSRISLKVGVFSAFIAAFFGILLGAFSGYYGDDRLKVPPVAYVLGWIGFLLGIFWGFISRAYVLSDAFQAGFWTSAVQVFWSCCLPVIGLLVFARIGMLVNYLPWAKKKTAVPLDSIVQRFTEVFNALPKLLIIITLAAVFREKSVGMVIGIIGFTNWPSVSRFTRAEMLRTKNLSYIEAARSIGMKDMRIIFRHALPNAFAPVFIEIAFIVAGSIVAESSLSFLGIGVPDDVVTWGSILSAGRQQFDAWWMVLFPGLAIFITVFLLQTIGERLRESANG